MSDDSQSQQHDYYAETASAYDDFHKGEAHLAAYDRLRNYMKAHPQRSYLECGVGTGQIFINVLNDFPTIRAHGFGPYQEELDEAEKKGIPWRHLQTGDATAMRYEDQSYDVVAMFGVLHHIPTAKQITAVREMIRVARKVVFISDRNGLLYKPRIKRLAHYTGTYGLLAKLSTKGKGYHESERDGITYPLDLLRVYEVLREAGDVTLYATITKREHPDIWQSASHMGLLLVKR